MNREPVVIIGAGWAGLSAAVKLTRQGYKVTVFESAKQAGGRARGVNFNDLDVDNGQHLLIGAYTECLSLMKTVGINIETALKRLPLLLTVVGKTNLILQAPALPAPLHLLYALVTAKGLNVKDKIAAVRFGLSLKKHNYQFDQDVSIEELFTKTKQTTTLIKQLWEPLCLATMNTPIETASANVFMRVFKDAFTNKTKDADSLLPTTDLSSLFPKAAVKYIESKDGKVNFRTRVENIEIIENKITSVTAKINNELENIKASQVIIAVAPQNINKLIIDTPALKDISENINEMTYQPIVTVYLQYSEDVELTQAMIGLSNTLSQWVFDRGSFCQQNGLISVVISTIGEHMAMDDDKLTQTVHDEISVLFTKQPTLIDSFVIREKRATFSCTVNINDIRPRNITPVEGLYLAGDYTDTGYPATLEGAVRSGIAASNLIIDKIQ